LGLLWNYNSETVNWDLYL